MLDSTTKEPTKKRSSPQWLEPMGRIERHCDGSSGPTPPCRKGWQVYGHRVRPIGRRIKAQKNAQRRTSPHSAPGQATSEIRDDRQRRRVRTGRSRTALRTSDPRLAGLLQ
jgi:hypothetical protein